MSIGITGATGALGKALMRRFPGAVPIGHTMPTEPLERIVHAACPNWRDPSDVVEFGRFNLALAQYVRRHSPEVVSIGSWWQDATGTCRDLDYTRMKDYQQGLFPQARHVVAYSIFGPDKGFGLDVAAHVTGERPMLTIGTAWRDFIHVDDVADAVAWAFALTPGTYAACSGEPVRVDAVAHAFGIDLPTRETEPSAELAYRRENIAATTVHLSEFIAHAIAVHAARSWAEQSREWKAA